jgi:hypothetical protein
VAEGAAVNNQSAEVSHSPRRIENKRPPATGSTQGANLVATTYRATVQSFDKVAVEAPRFEAP